MIINSIKIVLPIFIVFIFGIISRRLNLINKEGCNGIKSIASNFLIPFIVFNAFSMANYSINSLLLVIMIFLVSLISFLLGHVFKKIAGSESEYFPFMMTTFEGGNLGIPMIMLLIGSEGLSNAAMYDFGNSLFGFMICIPLLQAKDGGSANILDSIKKGIISPTFISVLTGAIVGLLGFKNFMENNKIFFELYDSLKTYITAAASPMVMIAIGYELDIKKHLIVKIIKTVISRVIILGVLCLVMLFVISNIMPLDKSLLFSTILFLSLPISYGLPIFVKNSSHADYISANISINTIVYLIAFVFISIAYNLY